MRETIGEAAAGESAEQGRLGSLPSMGDLDAVSAELDDIDAVLARMDAAPQADPPPRPEAD